MRNRESLQEKTLRGILKNRRLELGLSQRAIACHHDFPHSFISKYETGERFLTFSEVINMCRYLELNIHQVVDEIASLPKEPVRHYTPGKMTAPLQKTTSP